MRYDVWVRGWDIGVYEWRSDVVGFWWFWMGLRFLWLFCIWALLCKWVVCWVCLNFEFIETLPLKIQFLLNRTILQLPIHPIPLRPIFHTLQIVIPFPQPYLQQFQLFNLIFFLPYLKLWIFPRQRHPRLTMIRQCFNPLMFCFRW